MCKGVPEGEYPVAVPKEVLYGFGFRLHSLCILQGGQRILGGDLKFLEQKKGGYENCLNISGGMLIFCKILSSFCNGFKR